MSTPDSSYFAAQLAECRAAYARARPGFLRGFILGQRLENDDLDQVDPVLREHYDRLLKRSQVVWGCVAQVNMGMFMSGPIDLPGVTVYSTDAYFDDHPQDLRLIGHACFQFKNTAPVDADFERVAGRLTDEFDQTVRMALPRKLVDGREVFLAATMFHRKRLPDGILHGSPFPLLIAPTLTEVNMVLPLAFWPVRYCADWKKGQDLIATLPTTTSALAVAEAAEKRPANTSVPFWDVNKSPIYVTRAMAMFFVELVGEHLNVEGPYLFIGLRETGEKYVDLLVSYNRLRERCFESNGVRVVIRKDQVDQLRGAVVDYKNSVFARGMVIKLQGE